MYSIESQASSFCATQINSLTWDLDLYFGKHECLLKQRARERRLRGILDVNSDWMQIVSMAHKVLDTSFGM